MNPQEVVNFFTDEMFFVTVGENVYLMDEFHIGDADCDYGIYAKLSVNDLLQGRFDLDNIPDMYYENFFVFCLGEDLRLTYKLPKSEIVKLSNTFWDEWDIVLRKDGYDKVADSFRICKIMRGEEAIEPMSIEEIRGFEPSPFELKCITNYERRNISNENIAVTDRISQPRRVR